MNHPWRQRKVKRLPTLNQTIPRRRKWVMIPIASALLSQTRGMTLTHIFQQCPMTTLIDPWYDTNSHFLVVLVTTRLLYWAVFGCPQNGMISTFLGLRWLSLSPILLFVKETFHLYPSSSNLGQVHHWVGRSWWTKRFPIKVSWVHFNKPMY